MNSSHGQIPANFSRDVCAAHLCCPHVPPTCTAQILVGVITPYRSQRDLLRETFARTLGAEVAAEVRIETIDSFQVGSL